MLRTDTHIFLILALILVGCGGGSGPSPESGGSFQRDRFVLKSYAIQVGAFLDMDNAARLTAVLQDKDLDAFYYLSDSGFYKVRFGDFESKAAAQSKAESLHAAGVIRVYYIVGPEDYPARTKSRQEERRLRESIAKTARGFIGVPYHWGGTSPEKGFDCSGLTWAVYRLNGMDLPRTSRAQWRAGTPVNREDLSMGDLVFFSTSGGGKTSHVGVYMGGGEFIHAPGRGKRIRAASLANSYFAHAYLGGRRYL